MSISDISYKKYMKFIREIERYNGFALLDTPQKFNEMFKNKDFNAVQTFSITKTVLGDLLDVGFCGQFKWENNTLTPLDGDSYNEEVLVMGYEEWSSKKKGVKNGLNILVGDDW